MSQCNIFFSFFFAYYNKWDFWIVYLDLIISDKVKAIIEKTCQFLLENGSEHEEYLLKSKSANDENFGFLFQENPYHIYYKTYWEWLKSSNGNNNKKFDFYEIINIKQRVLQAKMEIEKAKIEIPTPIISNNSIIPQSINLSNSNNGSNNFQNTNSGMNTNNNPQYYQPQNNLINQTPINNPSQPKKKNRWSDSTVIHNENNNTIINNNTRPLQGYQNSQLQQPLLMNGIPMNITYPTANCYSQSIHNNPMGIPNLMNQMNVVTLKKNF